MYGQPTKIETEWTVNQSCCPRAPIAPSQIEKVTNLFPLLMTLLFLQELSRNVIPTHTGETVLREETMITELHSISISSLDKPPVSKTRKMCQERVRISQSIGDGILRAVLGQSTGRKLIAKLSRSSWTERMGSSILYLMPCHVMPWCHVIPCHAHAWFARSSFKFRAGYR